MANIGTPILGLPTVTGLNGEEWVPLVQGGTTKRCQSGQISLAGMIQTFPAGIDYVMSAAGGVVQAGVNGSGIQVPFDCTISAAVVNGNVGAGSIVLDIWKCTETQYDGGVTHPASTDSITASDQPTITLGSKTTSTMTGWTTALSQGDWLWYNVISNSGFTSVTVALKVTRSLP